MSRSQNLRHSVINQVIEDMARGNIPPPLPPQSGLAKIYNISRTTVHHIPQHLSVCSVLTPVGENYAITRKLEQNDGFDCITVSLKEQNRLLEQAFSIMINLCQLRAGGNFSELQLARAVSVSPIMVREYLLKFGRCDLIQSEKHGQRSMKQFDQPYAEQLFELRKMLETHPLQHFLNLPDSGPRWLQAKTMLERYRMLRDSTGSNFRMFFQLDHDFHAVLLSATDNIFSNQSLEIISVTFHLHHQQDESDLKQRNIIAVDEHMITLSALICRSDLDAIMALRNHLDTAKQSMVRSIRQYHR